MYLLFITKLLTSKVKESIKEQQSLSYNNSFI